jgi:hypothetical protein
MTLPLRLITFQRNGSPQGQGDLLSIFRNTGSQLHAIKREALGTSVEMTEQHKIAALQMPYEVSARPFRSAIRQIGALIYHPVRT